MALEQSYSGMGGDKSKQAFRTIGEVSSTLDLPQHVLRFWETRFSQIKPLKRGGNRRYYRPEDIDLLRAIKTLLYREGYTIKGVQKRFREQGVKSTVAAVLGKAGQGGAGGVSTTPAAASAPRGTMSSERRDSLEDILAELKTLRRMLD